MLNAVVLYKNETRFILKLRDGVIAHLLRDELSEKIEAGNRIAFNGELTGQSSKGHNIYKLGSADDIEILPKGEPRNKKPAEAKKPPTAAAKKSPEPPAPCAVLDTKNRFMILSSRQDAFQEGSYLEYKHQLVKIVKLGREFVFKRSTASHSKLQDGALVCYVYFEPTQPSSDEFFTSTKQFYEILDFIKLNGVKPRHKASEVTEIKKASVLCDSRVKIEGNSWIAYDEERVWYITHKLSPIDIENNIKINNQMAQCWRIPIWQMGGRLELLKKANMVMFKSGMIPAANPTVNDDDFVP